jgi:hypothetical protein
VRGRLRRLFGERLFFELGYYFLLARPEFRRSAARLRRLHDRYKGERCFILGNGPSLSRMDLSPLAGEFTFGLNRIYLLFPELGFTPSFYVAVNKLVIEQCAAEILAQVPGPKFISYDARRWIEPSGPAAPDILYLLSREGPRFFSDPARGVWQGGTVTYVAMQIAYFLGFRQVILLGVDHAFETGGAPHTTVVSQGSDPDHFDPGYFGPGFRWQLPDLALSEQAYHLAKAAFERDGRQILDATLDGKLQVFRKVEYAGLFGERP